jgi:hypothetical protein
MAGFLKKMLADRPKSHELSSQQTHSFFRRQGGTSAADSLIQLSEKQGISEKWPLRHGLKIHLSALPTSRTCSRLLLVGAQNSACVIELLAVLSEVFLMLGKVGPNLMGAFSYYLIRV